MLFCKSPIFSYHALLQHLVHQLLITIHMVICHKTIGQFCEELLCTVNLGLLDWPQVQTLHRAFGFRHKVDVLHLALMKHDCPIRGIVSHRSRNKEAFR